jgi:hypothetical protein
MVVIEIAVLGESAARQVKNKLRQESKDVLPVRPRVGFGEGIRPGRMTSPFSPAKFSVDSLAYCGSSVKMAGDTFPKYLPTFFLYRS